MLTGWIKIDEMAANNTSPPTSIQLCGKTSTANRRGSAAATPAHGTAPKLCISAERKRNPRDRYLRRFFQNFPGQPRPGTSDTLKTTGGSAAVA